MRSSSQLSQVAIAHKKRTKTAAFMIFLVIPACIALGYFVFRDRSYMLISCMVLAATVMPFYMVFEKRKPKAREIVLIAMYCALVVVIQLTFSMTIPINVSSAMVILSGIALGPEAGFLIGALARFLVNFYVGQGPWTPWQMFCCGILAFLAGIVFNQPGLEKKKSRDFKMILGPVVCILVSDIVAYLHFLWFPGEDTIFMGWRLYIFSAIGLLVGVLLQRKRLPVDDVTLATYTFFTIFIIYGGLINICAMVTAANIPGNEISWNQMKILYISAVGYDARHALGSAVFMYVFGNSMLTKLERIKIKYGIYR